MTAHSSICALAGFGVAMCVAAPALAVSPEACTRVTHVSHGGQADHADLGEGRVMWRDWWSQEGSATDFALSQCDTGETLRFRSQETNMNARPEFDRRQAALDIVMREHGAARAFATLARVAAAVEPVARDVRIAIERSESCACAAYYPQMRGDKQAFTLEGD